MKKIILSILIVIFLMISVTVTIFLFNYDGIKVTNFGGTSFVNLDEDMGNYNKNDLLIISNKNNNSLKANDEIVYFKVGDKSRKLAVDNVKEVKTLITKENYVYLNSGETVKNADILGNTNGAKNIANLGGIMRVLESKWGYLCFIVLPVFLIFAFEVYSIGKEVKTRKK